jgi:hypothetical protein
VYHHVSPTRGVKRFGIKGKLAPRYIGPFLILARLGNVVYHLELPPVSSVFPQILPYSAPRVLTSKFLSSSRPLVECSHRLNVHLSTCRREPLRRLWCVVVSHRRCRCSAVARRCSSRDALARSSTMRSRAVSLVLPRPILSPLADDYRPYHHLTSTALSPFRCSVVLSLRG